MSEASMYKESALDSMTLVVEHFNRPHSVGRTDAVLLFLNHSLEMIAKSILLDSGIDIRNDDGSTIPFSKCITYLHDGHPNAPEVAILNDPQKQTLHQIRKHRNEAAHGNITLCEQRLYAYTKSGVTSFDHLLTSWYDEQLQAHLPNRVLPISSKPLKYLDLIYQEEEEHIEDLLEQGEIAQARARARSMKIEGQSHPDESSPSEDELNDTLDAIEIGEDLDAVFPGVSAYSFDVEQAGPTINLQFTHSEGVPVHFDEDDNPHVIGYREINPWDRYNLGIQDLADHIDGATWVQVWAIVRALDLHGKEEYHSKLTSPSGDKRDRYTQKAIGRVQEAIDSGEINPEQAWEEHGFQN